MQPAPEIARWGRPEKGIQILFRLPHRLAPNFNIKFRHGYQLVLLLAKKAREQQPADLVGQERPVHPTQQQQSTTCHRNLGERNAERKFVRKGQGAGRNRNSFGCEYLAEDPFDLRPHCGDAGHHDCDAGFMVMSLQLTPHPEGTTGDLVSLFDGLDQ